MGVLRLVINTILAVSLTTKLCYTQTRLVCNQNLKYYLALDMFLSSEALVSNHPFSRNNYFQILYLTIRGDCPNKMFSYDCKRVTTSSVELTHRNISLLKMYIPTLPNHLRNIIQNENHTLLSSSDTCFSEAFSSELLQLDLSHNALEIIQYDLSFLRNLQILILSHNRLRYITPPVLDRLEVLNLSHNNLGVIPAGFFKRLQNLTHIDLTNNQLIYFSPFKYPKTLTRLYLSQNKLSALDVFKLQRISTELKEITLAANPWTCECMFDLIQFTATNKIRRSRCDENYFAKGIFPVCVVTEHMPCSHDYIHGTAVLEEFQKTVRNFSC